MREMDFTAILQVSGGNNFYDCIKVLKVVNLNLGYSNFSDTDSIEQLLKSCTGCYFSEDLAVARIQISEVLNEMKSAAMTRRMQQSS